MLFRLLNARCKHTIKWCVCVFRATEALKWQNRYVFAVAWCIKYIYHFDRTSISYAYAHVHKSQIMPHTLYCLTIVQRTFHSLLFLLYIYASEKKRNEEIIKCHFQSISKAKIIIAYQRMCFYIYRYFDQLLCRLTVELFEELNIPSKYQHNMIVVRVISHACFEQNDNLIFVNKFAHKTLKME